MKRLVSIFIALVILFSVSAPFPALAAPRELKIPTFSIVSVVTDTSVTIKTSNFPANDTFNVLMSYIGTRGVNGIKVTTISSGAGGSFTATFNVPDALKGLYQISIRLQSNTGSGYFAYNWFYNNTKGSGTGGGGFKSIPTFTILSVIRDKSVTIKTNNFPVGEGFNVLMGKMGTRGVNGIKVTSINSGTGGTFTATFDIPAALKDLYQIAIRLQSNTGRGYYAFNWFYNNTTGSGTGGGGTPGYKGIPTFSIVSVVRNKTVTILTTNFPKNDTFKVLMGPMGTRGINGYYVTTVDSGAGGKLTFTFNIPVELKGSYQISIRLQSNTGSGYYAYNWFYNSTIP